MAQNGNIILVGLGGTTAANIIGGCKSCHISIDGETVEISSATEQTARTFIGGRTSWKVTLSYLVTTLTSIQNISGSSLTSILNVNSVYTLYFGERNGQAIGNTYVSGSAILAKLDITATIGNLIQGSIEFQGSGHLS